MEKPCSCIQFIKTRIFYWKSRENLYQYYKSHENPYQVLQVMCTVPERAMNWSFVSESLHVNINGARLTSCVWGDCIFKGNITTLENMSTPLFEEPLTRHSGQWKTYIDIFLFHNIHRQFCVVGHEPGKWWHQNWWYSLTVRYTKQLIITTCATKLLLVQW